MRYAISYYVIHFLIIIIIIITSAILSKFIDFRRSGRRIVHSGDDTKFPLKNYLLLFGAMAFSIHRIKPCYMFFRLFDEN